MSELPGGRGGGQGGAAGRHTAAGRRARPYGGLCLASHNHCDGVGARTCGHPPERVKDPTFWGWRSAGKARDPGQLRGRRGLARDVLGGGGGLAGTPLLLGSPYGPRRRRAKIFEASILLAPKAPKQNFGCQSQTLEGEEEGGGSRRPPTVYGRSNTSLGGAGGLIDEREA